MDARRQSNGWGGDALTAVLLACLMTAVSAWRAWPLLSALHLPDTDDMMRLQQIRDWLAGQDFTDLTQHRLGMAPGLAMHWSRLADLVPGAIISLMAPHAGRHDAELIAVILWPAMLFAAALFLVATITRRINGRAASATAIIIAAIAYPVTTLFQPGRIDHHGFQMVLLLTLVRAIIARPTMASGVVAGLATTASLIIGLETAPLLLAAALLLWIGWCRATPGSDRQLLGYGLSMGMTLGFGAIIFGGSGWAYPACDGFTERAWSIAQAGAFVPIALAITGQAGRDTATRLVLSAIAAALLTAVCGPSIDGCIHPYATVDPLLARLWLDNVGEAQPLFAASPATAIGYAGLMLAGILASLWCWRRTRDGRWGVLAIVQLTALGLSCWQLRGAYAGTILAAPALAQMVAAARARGAGWLAAAWLASAGILYPLAAQALARTPGNAVAPTPPNASADCTAPDAVARLAALPSGTVIAPIDAGPYLLAGTGHRLIAAPYHRNNAGNAAMYRFLLASPEAARRIAVQWHARYLLLCPDRFPELGSTAMADRHRMIGLLRANRVPAWLKPIDGPAGGVQLFGIDADR